MWGGLEGVKLCDLGYVCTRLPVFLNLCAHLFISLLIEKTKQKQNKRTRKNKQTNKKVFKFANIQYC